MMSVSEAVQPWPVLACRTSERTLDFTSNKVSHCSWSPIPMRLTVFHTKVMQPASGFHDGIGVTFLGVPKGVFDDTCPFHPGQPMFDSDAGARQLSVGSLL